MKNIFATLLCVAFISSHAQDFKLTLKQEITQVNIIDITGAVEIYGITGNDIRISTLSPAKDAGARKDAEADNTQKGINYKLKGNKIVLKGTFSEGTAVQYRIEIPKQMLVTVEAEGNFTKSLLVQKVTGKIDINTNADVTIPDLSNGLVLQNNKGNTTIGLAGKIKDPVSIITQSGNVAVQIPDYLGVDLQLGSGVGKASAILKTRSGVTNFNGRQFTSGVNGGGTKIQIRSVSGNILVINSK